MRRFTAIRIWNSLVLTLPMALSLPMPAAAAADLEYWTTPVPDPEKLVQAEAALKAQGYDPGPLDGKLDAKSRKAVREAQKDRELEPTGRLDRRTAAALGVDVAPGAGGAPGAAVGASAPGLSRWRRADLAGIAWARHSSAAVPAASGIATHSIRLPSGDQALVTRVVAPDGRIGYGYRMTLDATA